MSLYKGQLEKTPGDPDAIVGLTRVLLRQQKVSEAEAVITPAATRNRTSIALQTALGEAQLRAGTPWLAQATVEAAMKLNACDARLRFLHSRLLRLESMNASASKELKAAHKIDPRDPEIRLRWLGSLSVKHRITELETYLASEPDEDSRQIRRLQAYLASLQKRVAEPRPPCRLVSKTFVTTIPFVPIHNNGVKLSSFGLAVKLNGGDARLAIDTMTPGLTISKALAERLKLMPGPSGEYGVMVGPGGHDEIHYYRAHADEIQVGSLDFRDCDVNVVDRPLGMEADGMIGTSVFSGFLIALDYPARQLTLGLLPKRPEDAESQIPSLDTSSSSGGTEASSATAAATDELPDAPNAQSTAAPKVSRGPHDRYIAPEMESWTRIYRSNAMLLVPTQLNGQGLHLFAIGSGAQATFVSPVAGSTVTIVEHDDHGKHYGIDGHPVEVYKADHIELAFGTIRATGKNVLALDDSGISRVAGTEITGVIGAETLATMIVSIDYRDGLVKFRIPEEPKNRYLGVP